ncbi:MAG: response regulator [Methyloprofundus sp.]|nr:response regulator [Methyloprofundus sp.]
MLNFINRFFTKSLMRQLILGIAGVHAILMSLFVYDLVQRQHEFLIEQNTQQVFALAESLSAASTSWVLANDLIGIEEVIQAYAHYPELRYVMLLNQQGQVLGYSDRNKVGMYVSDRSSLKLLTAAIQPILLVENSHLIDVAIPIRIKQQHIGWARVALGRNAIANNLEVVIQKGMLYMLIAIIVGILFAWVMASGLTHAIRQLRDIIERTISRQLTGTFDNRTTEERDPSSLLRLGSDLNRSDELGQLSHDFNLMQKAIRYREQQLNNYQKKLSHILNSLDEGVLTMDKSGIILMINNTTVTLFAYARHELVGLEITQLIPQINLQQKSNAIQLEGLKKDKSVFPIRVSIVDLEDESNEKEQRYLCSFQDISKQLQQEKLLRRAQKMEAVGQLTGGIAHDFNNQLGVIQGYLSFLDEAVTIKSAEQEWVNNATRATQHCIHLSRQLLNFARHRQVQTEQLDLNAVLLEVRDMIEHSITPTIQLNYYLSKKKCMIKTNRSDLVDSILNLVINARDVMPQGGILTFKTHIRVIDKSYAVNQPNALLGNFVQLSITDTGGGIPKAVQERIFDPFFTTKANGKGTGLGLSMVYSFAQRSKGQITFSSKQGAGTSFYLLLPYCVETRSKTKDKAKAKALQVSVLVSGQGEKILVVEDEPKLRELAVAYLHKLSYRTVTAATAQEALQVLAKDPTINLVFSDIIMPGGVNGYELAEQVTEQYPQIKILLTSGFSGGAREEHSEQDYHYDLLAKPYTKKELGHDIARLLKIEQQILVVDKIALQLSPLESKADTLAKEHEDLQATLNNYKKLLATDAYTEQQVTVLLQQVLVSTKQHFKLEEWVLCVCHYPFYENHKQVHEIILQQLETKIQVLKDDPGSFQHTEMLSFLEQNLIAHIVNMDSAYSEHIKAHQPEIDAAMKLQQP